MKHLNPRKGITTQRAVEGVRSTSNTACETPKSPQGDYNKQSQPFAQLPDAVPCETPKSPQGDYNLADAGCAQARPVNVDV